ncbi:MAG TPA: tryptophan synthase subunit alpha, partial [Spirochaetia bacterium]|nr:tryptophan synthase subunit alpha [Spirochaetia bacterium]
APVMLMSYASLVYARPMETFVREALNAGVAGLIVPDLPIDSDEGLYAIGTKLGIDVVPVVVPSMSDARLDLLRRIQPRYVYAALRSGITGSYTDIGEENFAFLRKVAAFGPMVLAGFGVRSPQQVALLAPHVHAVVVGSAFVGEIASAGSDSGAAAAAVGRLASTLIDAGSSNDNTLLGRTT